MVSNEEIADALDLTHDELLMRGRSGQYEDDEGRICIIHATGNAVAALRPYVNGCDIQALSRERDAFRLAVTGAISERTPGGYIVSFNYKASDDEVFDLLKTTAKELREVGA